MEMGNKPSPSPLPSAASVVKSKEDNGFKLIQVNLDANADGNGISPWSIVAIVMATLLSVWILTRLRQCYQTHIRSKPTSRSIECGPLRYESSAPNNHAEAPEEEEIGGSGTRRGGRNNKRIRIRRALPPGPERKPIQFPSVIPQLTFDTKSGLPNYSHSTPKSRLFNRSFISISAVG